MEIIYNPISLSIYDSRQNIALVIIFFIICALFVLTIFIMLKKKKLVILSVNVIVFFLFLLSFCLLYNRGNSLSEIRGNGYILLNHIEKFKKLNNRYPYDIDEIYSFMEIRNKNDYQKVIKSNNMYSVDFNKIASNDNECFSLTIDDKIIGYGYFVYHINPIRFDLEGWDE
ncbi:MAG: hypothetical protein PHN88_15060 [Ignavibacteria bacterium]|nr:hypothetical protein [Ignavibacteria bacterium]